MKNGKIQRPRNIVFLFMVILTSLTFLTLFSCSSKQDANKSRQLLNKSKSAADLKVDPTPTKPSADAATRTWTCASCGCANTQLNQVCVGCGLNKQDLLNQVKKTKVGKKTGMDEHEPDAKHEHEPDTKQDAPPHEDQLIEACPVCLEEGILAGEQSHQCEQCKKLICIKCHQTMQEASMNFCPLCRYEPASKAKPSHRRRSNTL